MVTRKTGANFGLLPAADLWLTETFVSLGNIFTADTKVR
jgi:hypothetical protein